MTILRTHLRSYNERPRHPCKVARGVFTRGVFLRSPLKEESALDTPPLISNVGSWL